MATKDEHHDDPAARSDDVGPDELAPDVSSPAHDQLYQEVSFVRTRGAGNLADVIVNLPGLWEVAETIGAGASEDQKIEDALTQGVQRLGGIGTPAIEALLGLAAETRGESVTSRRERAAALYDYKAYEVFRTRFEPSLLMFVATHLRLLVDERRLAERERVLKLSERTLDYYLEHKRIPSGQAVRTVVVDISEPEPPSLPPIYHLAIARGARGCGDEPGHGWVYSRQKAPAIFQATDYKSASRVRRMFGISNRRYYVYTKKFQPRGYRRPNWIVRGYRSVITRFW